MIDTAPFRQMAVQLGFDASCDAVTGSLLRTLAASKPRGRILELGTGLGFGTAHLLAGMDTEATLETVELDVTLSAAAQSAVAQDARVTFTVQDGTAWIHAHHGQKFDLIFADTWPGKFWLLDEALALLGPGGIYVIDDLVPQPNWPDGHQETVDALRANLNTRPDLHCAALDCATGLMICVRKDVP
ncbi:SAM-dependent methyltransferase [Deinococcus sp. KSM4-11]|uniref:O-methyltransferase n=1 Tax=Deinococcus sp. KSM4-11 TaxID=2568654 RepID=UPI0010A31D3D|nr:class I SAM-dependent methyltransferase [Deinococcus sp. KSM4-11]THF87909.1 SAM-dependent methyltransferase [Deinococcus sp. KSM4-11]